MRAETGSHSAQLRILYLEARPEDAARTIAALESAGIPTRADVTASQTECARLLAAEVYDVILADHRLPGWNGLDVLDVLRERECDVPLVLVTGYLGEEAAVSGLKKGASDIVYKDRLAVLPAAVWRAVQERALREAQARAEKALRAANQVLTALIRCAPLPITVIDRHGTVNVWNPAAEEVLGYGKEEALGNRLSELVGGDLAGLLERSLDEGGVIGAETRHRRPDGATVDVRVYSSPLRGAGEEIHGVVGMITDVTERNLIVEAFRESKERFQSAFLYAPIGMAIASLDGRILRVNPAFCRMLGTTEAELLRRSWQDLVHPRDRCVPGGEAEPGAGRRELRLVARDGRVVFAQWDTSLVCDSGGRPQYQIGQVVDITAAKEAEEKIRRYAADLERSNADLQHFAYVASHDLQEPLRMVRGFVELLARRYQGKLGPDADEYIRYAVDGARRMQDLIRGLLAYSRVGTQGKSFAPVAAEEPFRRALMNLQAAIEESGAEVSCDPLPAVLADDTQLAQLFQNLIGNAVKFRGEDPPRIAVRVADKKEVWEFAVEDNGIGFDPQHADRIFQMFQRLHGPTKYAGTGIGLALCKRIVERHGGGMRVESAPGKGSTFYFTLPKQPPQEVETGAASSAEVVGR